MISTIGIVKGTTWKMVYVKDDPILKDGFYYQNAGDPPTYVSAEKHSLKQNVHFHKQKLLIQK